MIIKKINKDIAIEFIQKYHYSKILPRLTKHYLGLIENEGLVGVITLGWGTQPKSTIKKILNLDDYDTKDYLEIGKMCFLPNKNKSNFGSECMKELLVWIRENTEIKFLYTLADGIMGKCGYVYQASNFIYIGKFKTSVYMDRETGEKIHPRSAKSLCTENAEFLKIKKVFWLTHDFCEYKNIDKIHGEMFRYIYPINKNYRKVLKKYNFKLKNPKDVDIKYFKRIKKGKFIEIEKPEFNMNVFNHNFQKINSQPNLI